MRVYIKDSKGKVIKFPVPMALVRFALNFSSVGIKIAKRYVKEKDVEYLEAIDVKALSLSIKELRRYKGLKIVDVKSKDGDEVVIQI